MNYLVVVFFLDCCQKLCSGFQRQMVHWNWFVDKNIVFDVEGGIKQVGRNLLLEFFSIYFFFVVLQITQLISARSIGKINQAQQMRYISPHYWIFYKWNFHKFFFCFGILSGELAVNQIQNLVGNIIRIANKNLNTSSGIFDWYYKCHSMELE